jgi:hypothetical protein
MYMLDKLFIYSNCQLLAKGKRFKQANQQLGGRLKPCLSWSLRSVVEAFFSESVIELKNWSSGTRVLVGASAAWVKLLVVFVGH